MQTTKSNSIEYLKGFAAIFVVLHHAILYTGAEQTSPIWQIGLNMVMMTHVPLFFVIAGFLCHKQPFGPYLQKKALRILVPFFLFSALKLFYSTFISSEFAHGDSLWAQVFSAFVVGSLYWFPYAIVLCYCFAIFFWTDKGEPATKSKKLPALVVLIGLIFVNCRWYLPDFKVLTILQVGNAIRFFVFFLVGMMIRQYREKLSKLFHKYQPLIITLSMLVLALCSYLVFQSHGAHNYPAELSLGLSTMVILLAISKAIPQNLNVLHLAGKYSLQIMFFDSFNKVFLFALLPRLIPFNLPLILVAVVLNLLITCVACLIIEKIPLVRTLFGL